MIEKKIIDQISNLARIQISDKESELYAQQLSHALEYFDLISEVNTEKLEPLVTPVLLKEFRREDLVRNHYSADEIIQNAPDKAGMLFKVPPVV